jgi:hypothetical protein
MYTHPSLFAGSYLMVSQIRGVAPRIQKHHSNPLLDRSISSTGLRAIPHIVQGGEGKKKQLPSQCFCKEENTKKHDTFFEGGLSVIRRFSLFSGGLGTSFFRAFIRSFIHSFIYLFIYSVVCLTTGP